MRIKHRSLLRSFTVAAAVVAVAIPTAFVAPAQAAPTLPTVVSADPADATPYVLDGSIRALVKVGNTIIAGGTFTQVKEFGANKPILSRNNLFAFDATTGVISETFKPSADKLVASLQLSADGQSVYVGGQFTTIDGVGPRSLARLNVSNGARTAGFTAPAFDAEVKDIKLTGNSLWVGGTFGFVGGQNRTALATLNATTGAVTTRTTLVFAGTFNNGVIQITKMEVNPAGTRLAVIGNFRTIDAASRVQFAMLDISSPTATTLGWSTQRYTDTCSNSFNSYMRDLDFSPDGSFLVISTTGAYSTGPPKLCDTTARWETNSTGDAVQPTWINYTGGDTTYAVAVTDTAVYTGGHARWQNNPWAGDRAGAGAIPRAGIAALDPVNGMPYSWNPTRDTGVGVFDFLVTPQGLWVGHDTLNIGGEYHPRLAFFPLEGGLTLPANQVGSLPNDVYQLGRTSAPVDASVLYRVNAGGAALTSVDDGPDWIADTSSSSPYRNTGSSTSSYSAIPVDATVPASDTDRAPTTLFSTERRDPSSGQEMSWNFPVTAGVPVSVRLYLANQSSSTSQVGQRVFSVNLEGSTVLSNFDPVAAAGYRVGTMRSFSAVSDGSINIQFLHGVNDPVVNGIEIIRTDVSGATSGNDVQRRYFTGSAVDPTVTTPGSSAFYFSRGATLIDGTVYAGWSDGGFYAIPFDGTTFGAREAINLYPATTGAANAFSADTTKLTGMFFDKSQHRLYYTMTGDNNLYYRYFNTESRIVGAVRYTAAGDVAALNPTRVRSMFLSGGTLYFADSTTGNLLSIGFANDTITGPVATANTTTDWRARGAFAWNGTPKPRVGTPPVAVASVNCTYLVCSYDSSGSFDADGTVVSRSWSFGDSSPASTAVSGSKTFAADGTYNVALTVTDDAGQSTTQTVPVTVAKAANVVPVAHAQVTCKYLTCTYDGSTSTDSDGTVSGYAWDFGDTTSSTTSTGTHTFAAPGSYSVALTVQDNESATSTPDTVAVTLVDNGAPSAVANVTCTYRACTFDGSGSTDPENALTSYAWTFGDTATASTANASHTYAADGTNSVTLTVTDDGGKTSSVTQDVTVAREPNHLPTADAQVTCTYLVCSFNGTGSSDYEGPLASYAWDFTGGQTSTSTSGSVTFPAGGTYAVTLTVTDSDGATATATKSVTVAPLTSAIAYRAGVNATGNATTGTIKTPATVQTGDAMLLFVTTNTNAAVNSLTNGWTLVGQQLAGDAVPDMRTQIYSKVAGPTDANANSVLTLAATSKFDLTLVSYSGTDTTNPVASFATAKETATTAVHTTPTAAVADARSWAVSFWADKSALTSSWTLPGSLSSRSTAFGTGSGHISTAVADNAGPLGLAPTTTGQAATASTATFKAIMGTVVLKPAP